MPENHVTTYAVKMHALLKNQQRNLQNKISAQQYNMEYAKDRRDFTRVDTIACELIHLKHRLREVVVELKHYNVLPPIVLSQKPPVQSPLRFEEKLNAKKNPSLSIFNLSSGSEIEELKSSRNMRAALNWS